jgi:hypothetical protein
MARPDATTVGIYGSGKQARTQLQAVCKVRKIRRALRDDPAHARYVETVPAKGYRFIGAVVTAAPAEVGRSAESGRGQSGSPPADRSIASPDAQIPEPLVETTPVVTTALEGERKHVTVLFAHLDGGAVVIDVEYRLTLSFRIGGRRRSRRYRKRHSTAQTRSHRTARVGQTWQCFNDPKAEHAGW